MSKTPEEIAADAAAEWIKNSTTSHSLANACALYGYNAGFLAGYQAAKERYEARVKELEDSIIQSVDAMAGVKYDDENT
jgi:hypothetical protein